MGQQLSWLEHTTDNREVDGSSPFWPTTSKKRTKARKLVNCKEASLGTRKAALGKCPVDTCNRRGFSAEKRVHFGPPLQRNGPKQGSWSTAKKRLSGLERRLLASVRWTLATAVAFPQKSESILARHFNKRKSKKRLTEIPRVLEISLSLLEIQRCTLKTEHCELLMQL